MKLCQSLSICFLFILSSCAIDDAPIVKTIVPASKIENYRMPLAPSVAEEVIKECYKDISGFGIDSQESMLISSKGGNATYGEIKFASLQSILNDLNLTKDDVFYDLGSGVGKVCMQVALMTPARAVGVELSKTRIKKAHEALRRLEKHYKLRPRIEFREEDIVETNLKKAAVVFTCSTCFSEKLLTTIVEKCKKTAGTVRLISLKSLPGLSPVKVYQLPMTWIAQTNVYYYILANS